MPLRGQFGYRLGVLAELADQRVEYGFPSAVSMASDRKSKLGLE
jgi:hypothetical protein